MYLLQSCVCRTQERTDWLHRNVRQQALSSKTSNAINFTLTFDVDTALDRTGTLSRLLRVKVSRRCTRALQSSCLFLEVNVITVSCPPGMTSWILWSRAPCTYSIDTFARSHVKLESMTPSVEGVNPRIYIRFTMKVQHCKSHGVLIMCRLRE